MIDPYCDVEVGTHTNAYFTDKKSSLVVCSRHRMQYIERKDEFGPFEWETFVPETPPERFSDEEIKECCIKGIKDGLNRGQLYFKLKTERKQISQDRFFRIWAECGGSAKPYWRS